MTVYADVLFLTNFVSAYIMLYLLGKIILKTKIKIWRLTLGGAVSAAMAAAVFILPLTKWQNGFIRLLSALLPIYIAFYDRKKQIIYQTVWLFVLSLIMVAIMIMLASFLIGGTGIWVRGGVVYVDLPHKIFIPAFAVSYIIAAVILRLFEKRSQRKLYIIEVSRNGIKITLTALFDSGNSLRDPMSGKCVSLIEWKYAKKLLRLDCDYSEIMTKASDLKLRAVPFKGAEGKRSIMFAFVADINISDAKIKTENTLLGIYNGSLSDKNEYNALLNSALL